MDEDTKDIWSSKLMNYARNIGSGHGPGFSAVNSLYRSVKNYKQFADQSRRQQAKTGEDMFSPAQDSFLRNREAQQRMMEDAGYQLVNEDDYGTVKSSVKQQFGDLPIYQKNPDFNNVTRDQLQVLGNLHDYANTKDRNYDNERVRNFMRESDLLEHPGSYSSAVYVHPETGQLYIKSWDLNNYGPDASRNTGSYSGLGNIAKKAASFIDKVGSPVVVTTGFQPVVYTNPHNGEQLYMTVKDLQQLKTEDPAWQYLQNLVNQNYQVPQKRFGGHLNSRLLNMIRK